MSKAKSSDGAGIRTSAELKTEQDEQQQPVASSSSLREPQQQQLLQGMVWQNSEKSLAFLTHNESLRQIGTSNLLANWTEGDCMGLLVQMTKCLCDEEGANRIVRFFRDTTTSEVIECFNKCKEINKNAGQERSKLDKFLANDVNSDSGRRDGKSSTNQEKGRTYPNLSSLMKQVKKSRGISEDSSHVIAKFLLDCASDSEKCTDRREPDYQTIYTNLASMVQGYALKGLQSIDAAIILEIFDEMEREIDSNPKFVEFLKQMFEDFQHFSTQEFKLGEELTEENAGKLLMNTLEFPDSLLDLSKIYRDDSQE